MRYNVISSATLRKKRLEYSTQTISLHVSPGTGLKREIKVLKSQSYFAGLKRKKKEKGCPSSLQLVFSR